MLDPEVLLRSGFPWEHRRSVGRVRAFWKTVWLVTADAKALRHETVKAQSPGDASAFRRCVAMVLFAGFATAVVMLLLGDGVEALVVIQEPSPFARLHLEGYEADLLVPWSAGIAIRPALFVYALALGFSVAGAPRSIFRTKGLPPDYAATVESIGSYAAAPLAWLLPAAAGYALLFWLTRGESDRSVLQPLVTVLAMGSFLLVVLTLGVTVYRTGQWRARTTHRGYLTGFLAMGELILRWVVVSAIVLAVIPWCVGFIWIFIDSFRA